MEQYQEFWNWFASQEKAIAKAMKAHKKDKKNKEALEQMNAYFEQIQQHLSQVKEGLYFECEAKAGKKQSICITARAVPELFNDVEALCEAAPVLEYFTVTPFIQRMRSPAKFVAHYGTADLSYKDVLFYFDVDGMYVDLLLLVKGLSDIYEDEPSEEDEDMIRAVHILLEKLIGEYDLAYTIRTINYEAYDRYRHKYTNKLILLRKLVNQVRL